MDKSINYKEKYLIEFFERMLQNLIVYKTDMSPNWILYGADKNTILFEYIKTTKSFYMSYGNVFNIMPSEYQNLLNDQKIDKTIRKFLSDKLHIEIECFEYKILNFSDIIINLFK